MRTAVLALLVAAASTCLAQKTEIDGWSSARWGMTEREVMAAFPREAIQPRGNPSDRHFGNQTATIRIESADFGGIRLQANFFFDDNGGLVKVLLRRPESTPPARASEWFRTLAASMDSEYGEPTIRGSDARGDHLLSAWIFPRTVIQLSFLDAAILNMSLLAVTFEKRTSQAPETLMQALLPLHGKHFPKFSFSMTKPTASKDLSVHDDKVAVVFTIQRDRIGFELRNKTEAVIKIDWDQVSFVDVDGTASKVVHSGVRLIERDRPQVPSLVPPGAKITEAITPSGRIRYEKGWQLMPLLPERGIPANAICGRDFQVFMPLTVESKSEDRVFAFSVTCE